MVGKKVKQLGSTKLLFDCTQLHPRLRQFSFSLKNNIDIVSTIFSKTNHLGQFKKRGPNCYCYYIFPLSFRLDVSVRGFWQRGQRAFFDFRVFNPFAKIHLNQKLDTAFSSNENEKKPHYNQRIIEVEHGSFSPLVFSPYSGNGREAERFLTELAQKLFDKKQMDHSIVIHWLRAKVRFNLLRSAVLCVRGSRTIKHELNTDFSGAEIANMIGKIK